MNTPDPHARWLESETDRLLRFARGSALSAGGFGMLDDVGEVADPSTTDLLITCRMTYVFSLATLLGRPGAGRLADHGVASLTDQFADPANGGWWREVDVATGKPLDASKAAYAHAFVLLAAASAVRAGRPGAESLLAAAIDTVERYFWDDADGRVRESWDEAFESEEPYRGANSNMHSVEAFLAVADATGDPVWRERALRISDWLINDVARNNEWRVVEHFHLDGAQDRQYNSDNPAHQYRPYGATIGHALEWSRLLLHLRAALGTEAPAWLLEAAVSLFDTAVSSGWAVDGAEGFVYTVDWDGTPVVRERLHWVVAEAIAASAALTQATSDDRFAVLYTALWDHAAAYFIDEQRGSWHHELDTHNQPAASVWSGKPDIYHALQATLIPRLPLHPSLASAMAEGHLDSVVPPIPNRTPRGES